MDARLLRSVLPELAGFLKQFQSCFHDHRADRTEGGRAATFVAGVSDSSGLGCARAARSSAADLCDRASVARNQREARG